MNDLLLVSAMSFEFSATQQATGIGQNSGIISGAFLGGCFTGSSCTAPTDATNSNIALNLSSLATYTNSTGGVGAAQGAGWSTTAGAAGSITSSPSTSSTLPNYTWITFQTPSNTRPMLVYEIGTPNSTPSTISISNAHQLQLTGSTLGAYYSLSNNIDLTSGMTNAADVWGTNKYASTGAGFVPIGNSSNQFNGTFNGNSDTISNLYINLPNTTDAGLFGYTNNATINNVSVSGTATLENIAGLLGGQVDSTTLNNVSSSGTIYTTANAASVNAIGGLIGNLYLGTLSNAYSSVNIIMSNGGNQTGGLIGKTDTATINDVYSSGSITSLNPTYTTGGLVGDLLRGTLSNSFSSETINLLGSGTTGVGGLIGYSFSETVNNVYSIGSITTADSSQYIGGLLGYEDGGTKLSNAYSSSAISTGASSTDVGGLAGFNNGNTNATSYWDTSTSGISNTTQGCGNTSSCAGVTGENNTNMMIQSTFSGFSFGTSNTWGIIANQSFPYFQWEYPSTPQAVSGFILGTVPANASITIAANGVAQSTPPNSSYSAANGFYYNLFPNQTFSNTTNNGVILATDFNPAGNPINNALTIIPSSNASISGPSTGTGLDINQNAVTLNLTNGNISAANMSTAVGSLGSALYSPMSPYQTRSHC